MKQIKNDKLWPQYSKYVLIITALSLFAYSFWQVYQYYQNKNRLAASKLYDDILTNQAKLSKQELFDKANNLVKNYQNTLYASLTHLLMAKMEIEDNHMASAESYLRKALEGNEKNALGKITATRLARVLADQSHYQEALQLLASISNTGFETLFEETKGDIYVKKGEFENAKQAYQEAIKTVPQGAPVARIELKLADVTAKGNQ